MRMETITPLGSFADGLLDSDEKFRALVEHAVVGIYIIRNSRFSYVNQRLAEIFGYDREELIGKSNLDLTAQEDRQKAAENVRKRIEGYADSVEYTFRGLTRNGEIRYIHAYGSIFHYQGERAIIGTLIDETETMHAKQTLERLANYDSLTDLFNRRIFEEEFSRAIELGKQRGHRVAMLLMDIDNFKRINDSLGHKSGDMILQQIARRLHDACRKSELIARIGGDEFALVIEDFRELDEIGSLIQRLQEQMAGNFTAGELSLHLSMSIGVALFPEHGENVEQLQKAADIALYEAKKGGKDRYAFFEANTEKMLDNIRMEDQLSQALERDQLTLYFQPQIDLKKQKICCAEALIRWIHPERGIILPGEFLTLAAESGLLYRLDLFVLRQVFEYLGKWKDRESRRHITVAMNISNALFHHQQFLHEVRSLVSQYSELVCQVELELTEEIIMGNEHYADHLIRALRLMGFRFSIDDFGTGHSSLSHLKKLDVQKIKIDRSFIHGIVESENDRIIVEAIIVMGHALGLITLAEGVEDEKQAEILQQMGCQSAQGFYFAKPMPAEQFEREWLSL